jgi:hypothetical protein
MFKKMIDNVQKEKVFQKKKKKEKKPLRKVALKYDFSEPMIFSFHKADSSAITRRL